MKCKDFARQLSYHRAFKQYKDINRLWFWRTIYNNSIDLAVLDWLHLFGSHNDDLHWKRVIADKKVFKEGLLKHLNFDDAEWETYRKAAREYRNKDIAHIEIRPVSHIPQMDTALRAADYYYGHILLEVTTFRPYDEPRDLIVYHNDSLRQTEEIIARAYSALEMMNESVF